MISVPQWRASSLADLIHVVQKLKRDKSILWYRGQCDAEWHVRPGIYRAGHSGWESNYVHRFRARAGTRYSSLPKHSDYGRWLSLMQHYGLPTRLLDWSRSPLVAAYFALGLNSNAASGPSPNAAIWVLDPHCLNESEDGISYTPSLEGKMCKPLVRTAFSPSSKKGGAGVLAVMASEHDLRVFVQQGCYTVHADHAPLEERPDAKKYLAKIVLPTKALTQLRLEIEVCGYRKEDLFPDLATLAIELGKGKGR